MRRATRRLLACFVTRAAAGRVAIAGMLIVTAIGALSGKFAFNYRCGNVLLVALNSGTLRVQVVTDHVHAPTFTDCVWREIYYPAPVPDTGVRRHPSYCLEWTLPSLHRTFVSVTGTWWTFTLPLWCCLALGFMALWFCRRRQRVIAGNIDRGPTIRRRRVQWTSAIATFVLLAAWLLSGVWSVTFSDGRCYHVDIWAGIISIQTIPEQVAGFWADAPAVGVYQSDEPFQLQWTLPHTADCAQSTIGAWWEVNFPLWIIFLVASSPLIQAFYRRFHRRSAPGTCVRCRYDLTGNVSGRCPECGTPTNCGDQA